MSDISPEGLERLKLLEFRESPLPDCRTKLTAYICGISIGCAWEKDFGGEWEINLDPYGKGGVYYFDTVASKIMAQAGIEAAVAGLVGRVEAPRD